MKTRARTRVNTSSKQVKPQRSGKRCADDGDEKPTFKFSWDELRDEKSTEEGIPSKVSKLQTASSLHSSTGSKAEEVKLETIKKESKKNMFSESDDENLNYMQIRMKNMKENEAFLSSIGVYKAKEELQQVIGTKKPTIPSYRGLRVKKEPAEPLPPRKSLRLSRVDPDGIPLPEPVPVFQEMLQQRLPEGPVGLKDCVYSQEISEKDLDQFCSFLQESSEKIKTEPAMKQTDFISKLNKVILTEERVAKVVPGRVFSLEWHPSTDRLIAVAGDKYGHIGFWNVLSAEKEGSDIVTAFKPHIKPVSQLSFSLSDQLKLYSSSYDATLRCLDFQKCVFNEIFSVPEEEDDLLRHFSFVDSNTMVVAHQAGVVSVVDIRTAPMSAEQSYLVSRKSIQTIHVNPQSSHHFITAGTDSDIHLWDIRSMNKKSPKSLLTLKHHTKTVSSAYFSPDGQQILSCSADDSIMVFSVDNATNIDVHKCIRHNNHTGRWLTKFRPTWHPTVDNVFVSGSMARPRRIEIYDSINGSQVVALEGDNLNSVCSLNEFHPGRPTTIMGANSSGRLHVFM